MLHAERYTGTYKSTEAASSRSTVSNASAIMHLARSQHSQIKFTSNPYTLLIFCGKDSIFCIALVSTAQPQICAPHIPLEHGQVSPVGSDFAHHLVAERRRSGLQLFLHFPQLQQKKANKTCFFFKAPNPCLAAAILKTQHQMKGFTFVWDWLRGITLNPTPHLVLSTPHYPMLLSPCVFSDTQHCNKKKFPKLKCLIFFP